MTKEWRINIQGAGRGTLYYFMNKKEYEFWPDIPIASRTLIGSTTQEGLLTIIECLYGLNVDD